jgi:hypothetical protein
MQQDTSKTTGDVNKQDLQAVTGGCGGCFSLGSYAHQQAGQANENFTKLSQDAPFTASAEKQRAIQLTQISVDAQNSAKNPSIPGCAHCKNFSNLMKQMQPSLRLGK